MIWNKYVFTLIFISHHHSAVSQYKEQKIKGLLAWQYSNIIFDTWNYGHENWKSISWLFIFTEVQITDLMKQEERETMATGMCSDKSDLKYRKEGYHIIMSIELIMRYGNKNLWTTLSKQLAM